MGSSEKQIFPYFHGVPVAPLKVIGPRGKFHLFERALVDTGAALTSVPISVCKQLNLPYIFTRRIYTFSGWVNVRIHSAEAEFLSRMFKLNIASHDLPKEILIRSIVGRDILSAFLTCFGDEKVTFQLKSSVT